MSESLLTQAQKEPTEDEIKFYTDLLAYMDPEKLKPVLEAMSMLWRVLEGKPLDIDELFSGLLNVKSKIERTRYPNLTFSAKHVTLRLMGKHYPGFMKPYEDWAESEDEHLIAVEGEGRKEGVEILKAKGMLAQGISPVFLGSPQLPEKQSRWSILHRNKEKAIA